MSEQLIILGLSDADRYDLELLFSEQGSPAEITFNEPRAPAGVAKALDPLTATVAIGAMTLVAIWICRSTRETTFVKNPSTGEEITVRRTSKCEADVIRQLASLFSKT